MLNRNQLKNYRTLRGLSTRDVAAFCDISQPMIVQAENGTKRLTEHTHDEIVKGINTAYKKRMESYQEMKKKNKEKSTEAIKAAIASKEQEEIAPVQEEKIAETATEVEKEETVTENIEEKPKTRRAKKAPVRKKKPVD